MKLDQKALVKTIRLPISVSDAESSRPSTPAANDKTKSSPPKTTTTAQSSSKAAPCSSSSSSSSPSKTLNQWFTCKKCAFKARSKKVVEDHERTSHTIESPTKSGLRFKCDICGFSCGDVQKYRQHVKSHSGGDDDSKEESGRTKACNKCDFTTTYRWSFDRHVRHHNRKSLKEYITHVLTIRWKAHMSSKEFAEFSEILHGFDRSSGLAERDLDYYIHKLIGCMNCPV